MFINPTKVDRVTSEFRSSKRADHHGIDFANPGIHEIYAAAAGTVSRSYRSDSYGECIMIVHNINGQIWETVYAHMRIGSRKVAAGSKVKQGQVIGIMGNTGHSTGQHLHFELHKGRWDIDKINAVDPFKYLGLNREMPSVNTDGSAVDYLNSKKLDSSYSHRAQLASQYGIKNYQGTAKQNIELLNRLKGDLSTRNLLNKGKRVEAIVAQVNYYDSPRWTNPSGQFKKGEGWIVLEEIVTAGSPQLKVKNSNGKLFYITARKDLVKIK